MAPGAVCPSGHDSESTDYCDVCGSPMTAGGGGGGGSAAPAASSPPAGEQKPLGVVCPNCDIMNAPGALFCEACGYDYTTGTMPRPAEASVLDLDSPLPEAMGGPEAPAAPADQPATAAGDAPDQAAPSTPAPPAPDTPSPDREAAAVPSLDIDTPAPSTAAPPTTGSAPAASGPATPPRPAPAPSSGPAPAAPTSAPEQPTGTGPGEAESDTFEWVLEIWVDPEWYAVQQSPDPMPSAGLPDIMPLRKRTLLIGRPSRSRNIHPDIDCEPDTGISRRQAELSTDGTRWFIEDLGSANGTFVAPAAGALPDQPIASGRRHELAADERIYLGAWTRLVLRRATPEELEAYATA